MIEFDAQGMQAMIEFLAVVVWPLVTLYAIERGCAIVALFAPVRDTRNTAVVDAYDAAVPEDLVALTMQYPEAWAQEDMMKVIREKYDTLRDWNRVRSAVGVGRIDA